eukprot:TRINITY_DN16072_c0_g1_i2.p1 TRINITY_DN16072_c0_g1~~TRINITY_DN16072_c0_g1_i2.p1  ORF type:complete len:1178 (+),score=130.44 TRINITY_DN16072_c0_g1_i2:90-3623(+)
MCIRDSGKGKHVVMRRWHWQLLSLLVTTAHAVLLPPGCDWYVDGSAVNAPCDALSPVCSNVSSGIRQANERSGQTVCVAEGTYWSRERLTQPADICTDSRGYALSGASSPQIPRVFVLGVIRASMTIRGLGKGATIDGEGQNSGLYIRPGFGSARLDVTIEGLHFRNNYDACAGAILSQWSSNLVLRSSSFVNCSGGVAGAVWYHAGEEYHDGNRVLIEDVYIDQCRGDGSNPTGGLSISVGGRGLTINPMNNSFVLRDIRVSNSSAGPPLQNGYNRQLTSAGAISVSVVTTNAQIGNTVLFESIMITDCTQNGGVGDMAGIGGAGGISVLMYGGYSFDHRLSSITRSRQTFRNVTILRSSGGGTSYFGGAGGISVVLNSEVDDSTKLTQHSAVQNAQVFSNVTVVDCHGGTFVSRGIGAGGIAVAYHGEDPFANNTQEFSSVTVSECSGGDWSKGAGGIVVAYESGSTQNCSLRVQDSQIDGNQVANVPVLQNGVGAAGGMVVYQPQCRDSMVQMQNVQISRNRGCAGNTCEAGGLSVFGANLSLHIATFDSNESPAQAGGLRHNAHAWMASVTMINNSAALSGTARLGLLTAQLSSFSFPDTETALSAQIMGSSGIVMNCGPGEFVATIEEQHLAGDAFQCVVCYPDTYSLVPHQWVYGQSHHACQACPNDDSAKVICAGGSNVRSQQGYFLALTSSATLKLSRCPNPAACLAASVDETQCQEGYQGPSCAQCATNWFSPKMDPLICETCPNSGLSIPVEILVPLCIFAFSIYSAQRAYNPDNLSEGSSLLKMLIVHFTILETVEHVSWAWKDSVRQVLHIPASTSGSISDFSLECLSQAGFASRFSVTLIFPFGLLLLLVPVAWLMSLTSWSPFGSFKCTVSTISILALYLFVPACIANMFSVFPCYHSDGDSIMVYEPSSSCWHYPTLVGLACAAICILVATTVYQVGFGMVRHKESIQEMIGGVYEHDTHCSVYHRYGFLFQGYRPRMFFWEIQVLFRKCAVLIVATLTPPTYAMADRSLLLMVIILLSLIASTHYRPYLSERIHMLDVCVQMCSALSVLLATYITATNRDPDPLLAPKTVTLMFLIINVLVVVPVLCTMAVAYWPVIKASVGSLHRACCARMTSDGALMALQKPLLEESSSRDPDKMLLLTSDRTSEVGRDSDHLETADHA